MRLIMAGKLREGARDVRPFGKTAAPRLLVLGNDVKLRKIIGDEADARTRRIEIERSAFRFVFRITVAAFAPLEQLAIFLRDQPVRLGCRVAHRVSNGVAMVARTRAASSLSDGALAEDE